MAGHKSPYFSSERGSGHRTGKGPSPDIPSSSWGLAPGGSYPSRGIPALFSPRAPPHSGLAWTPRGRGDTAYDPRAGGPGQPAGPEEGADYTAQCPQAAPSRAHHGQAGSGPVRTGPPCPPPGRVLKDALRIGRGGGRAKTTSFANLCGSGFLAPGEPAPSRHLGSAPFYFPSAISSPWAATPPPWAFPFRGPGAARGDCL